MPVSLTASLSFSPGAPLWQLRPSSSHPADCGDDADGGRRPLCLSQSKRKKTKRKKERRESESKEPESFFSLYVLADQGHLDDDDTLESCETTTSMYLCTTILLLLT